MSEGGEGWLLRLQLLQLQPSLPPEGADAGAVGPDVDRIAGLGEGQTEAPEPPCDADVAAELQAPSRGPRGSYVDPVDVLGLDHGGNGPHLDPPSTLQHLLCSLDTLQWPWSGPAGTDVDGLGGGLECVAGGEHQEWESVIKRKRKGYQNLGGVDGCLGGQSCGCVLGEAGLWGYAPVPLSAPL